MPETASAGHVVIAPDKFKGTLTAAEVAAHVAAGLRAARGDLPIRQVPVADGGEGTVAAALAAGYRAVRRNVCGPAGQPARAEFAWRDQTAIIEAAQACGLTRLPGPQEPLTATSFGAGELIAAAVSMGARRIVLGLGGVACTDGGAGMVQALGGRLLDRAGRQVRPGGAALAEAERLDLTAMGRSRLSGVEVLVASDVDNPLLGEHGAAAVYGPQKGASPADVAILEAGLARWADIAGRSLGSRSLDGRPPGAARYADMPGAGAAGGLGFAALAFLGASLRPGIGLMLDMTGFAGHLAGARLVITGEGSLDTQTLRGKAPAGVARAVASAQASSPAQARTPARVPVIAVAGRCTLTGRQLRSAGIDAVYRLTDIEPDPDRCLASAGPLVERAARRLAEDWLPRGRPAAPPGRRTAAGSTA